MRTKIHGVIGGPRQKISPPRTKVDISNKIDIEEDINIVIVSHDKDELVTRELKIEESVKEEVPEETIDEEEQSSLSIQNWLLKLSGQSD